MKRRQVVAAGIVALSTGCLGLDSSDADGDGVIDMEDYAPNDPDVQQKDDVDDGTPTLAERDQTASGTPSDEPTPTPTDSPTATDSPTPTATDSPTATASPTDSPTPTASPTATPGSGSGFPSHDGTHAISGRDDYWAMKLESAVDFVLEYTVTNRRTGRYDFDVFVFDSQGFEDYKAKVGGAFTDPTPIGRASVENVKTSGSRTARLPGGTYHFVVDNTDVGGAGDWGAEATRRVHVALSTRRA